MILMLLLLLLSMLLFLCEVLFVFGFVNVFCFLFLLPLFGFRCFVLFLHSSMFTRLIQVYINRKPTGISCMCRQKFNMTFDQFVFEPSNQSAFVFSTVHPDMQPLPGLISDQTKRDIEEVISCWFVPAFFLVGLAGNIMSLAVLIHQGYREPTNLLLIGLTITDLLYVVGNFANEVECLVRPFDPLLAMSLQVWIWYYLVIVNFVFSRISRLFICLVAVERYIVVRYPFKANLLITNKVAFVAMVTVYVSTFGLCFILFFVHKVDETFHPELNMTVPHIQFSQFAIDSFDSLFVHIDFVLPLLLGFLPVALVLFCSCSIIRALRLSVIERSHMTGNSDVRSIAAQQKVTKMILSICILFIICTLPGLITQTARLLFRKDGFIETGRYRNITEVAYSIVFLFSLINSSINFLLYIVTSKKFVASFKQLFYCFWLRAVDGPNAALSESKATAESDFTST